MILFKIYDKIRITVKKMLLKMRFKQQIKFEKLRFRKDFNVRIEGSGYLRIGSNCFFNNACSINVLGKIEIGNDCIFGENVKMYDHNHIFNLNNILIRNSGFKIKNIVIGNNCWVGSNVVILGGTKIGDNCVIGAGVVASGVVPANSIIRSPICNTQEIIYKDK